MRPTVRFLDPSLRDRIIEQARDLLERLGVEIHNSEARDLLGDHGARIDPATGRAHIPGRLIDRSLETAPGGLRLFDSAGLQTHDLSGDRVHYTPGSAAIHILDPETGSMRKPATADYVRYAKLVDRLEWIAAQSTALIPADVDERISDSYRLFLSLLYGRKPVVTGAFSAASFGVMRDLQLIVRGSAEELRSKPLTIFSCCPTAPLKWSEATSQNVLDCARSWIPVELISMPLAGFMAPVTLVGTLVQHTAETLSGLVLSQTAQPGAPVLWGGSPAIFDIRCETTPMGAIETQMIDCAASEIGKHLGLPTQAYISLSDSKQLDAQAGLETASGAVLAALAGINSVSGPGMLDFESCQSLEKLVVDNEIAGMVLRMVRGIEPREDFPALPRFEELLREGHLLISKHTRAHLREEQILPGPAIDRANRSRWLEEGAATMMERARREVERRIAEHEPVPLAADVVAALCDRMAGEARRCGIDRLPAREP